MRTNRFYPKFLTGQRVIVLALVAFVAVAVSILLSRPASTTAPSSAEIAQAVNGPAKFERPSAMEYVPQTNSCVVGGTVTSTEWHVGAEVFAVGDVDGDTVDYTAFGFKSDTGRVFTVSANGALYTDPGENLGLELDCDAATMNTAPSFGMIAIIYGSK
jgi:hypothetical protein